MTQLKCVVCGKKFSHKSPLAKTCSPTCKRVTKAAINARRRNGRGVVGSTATCEQCGQTFVKTGTVQRFCTTKCQKKHNNRAYMQSRLTIETVCQVCGKDFFTSQNSRAKTCSNACKSVLMRKKGTPPMPVPMPCPWATGSLATLPPGVTSWDCPEMDPMSCGTARVMMKFETEARRKAA